MFSACQVRNFKGFENFTMGEMDRITLIGGRNNVGKTSLLEAMFMFLDRQNPGLLVRQFNWRGVPTVPTFDAHAMWSPVFFDYDLSRTIEVVLVQDGGSPATLSISYNENYVRPAVVNQNPNADPMQSIRTDLAVFPTACLDVRFKKADHSNEDLMHLILRQDSIEMQIDKLEPRREKQPLSIYLASKVQSNPVENAIRFGQLEIEGKTEQVVTALQIIEPRLKSLSTVTLPGGLSMVYGDTGLGHKIPLSYMGDGVSRLLTIVLSIIVAKDGVLFIDEIENGIHYSTLPTFWRVIATTAAINNCQIIASTHSYECLESALEGLPEEQRKDFIYIRLDREDLRANRIAVNPFKYDELKLAVENGWEVR